MSYQRHIYPWCFLLSLSLYLLACSSHSSIEENQASRSDCEEIKKLTVQVGEYLGQSSSHFPACGEYSQEEFTELLLELLERDGTEEELRQEELVLKHIGLIPSDYDYPECLKSSYLREAAAFYSPYLRQIILPAWSGNSDEVLVHEIIHFYQDELLSLSNIKELRGFFHDSALAHGAVLEGDAYLLSLQFIQERAQIPDRSAPAFTPLPLEEPSCTLPYSLRTLFEAQYIEGKKFWSYVEKRGTPTRIKILNKLPRNTSSVLHPEQFLLQGEKAHSFCSLFDQGEAPYHRSLGELIVRTTLEQFVDPDEAESAAAGIVDDCLTATEETLKWNIAFESIQDVEEFTAIIERVQLDTPRILPGEFVQNGKILTYSFPDETHQ